ncbi:rhodanese-like domain-containing protein [Sporosarcina sp. Te-1]|uniref:rhodanese-like domain-containing protein n=1 Tax=Sporosarcina sp. Te-1 TaxID=2818390 RepID=UPI001A9EE90E|nr:rhodanese-like domain-containing protein [Sporosarcina sp. Te-1]QTD40386.1 rhodanese-like domain-containing protein [Sporosarcina sp. Te-1]
MGWILLIVVVALLIWRIMPAKGVRTISTEELKGMLKDKSKQFVDVRTPGEYKRQHIKEFKNIPLHELNAKMIHLDKTKETIVICQSGMRSSKAAALLKKAGFADVLNVRGGMGAWHE